MLGNEAVRAYISRHALEILEQFELVLNAVSIVEALEHEGQPNRNDATDAGTDGAATEATGPGQMARRATAGRAALL
jgi:DNA-binding PucR family transcriptional regulator